MPACRSFCCGRRSFWNRARRRRAGASVRRRPRATASACSRARAGISCWSAAATDERANGWWSTIMSRIVSVWLPRWPILRFLAAQAKNSSDKPVDPERPFVLAMTAAGGPRLAALNEAAEAAGLVLGEPSGVVGDALYADRLGLERRERRRRFFPRHRRRRASVRRRGKAHGRSI